MVSLAANGRVAFGHCNLRELALWYPRIPDTSLNLNECGFTARKNAMERYEPLCWTLFGGPGGIHLRSLTGMSFTTDDGYPRVIEFHYNSEDVPLECRKLGRFTPSKFAHTMHFEIDGPGGEFIDHLTVHVRQHLTADQWFYESGILESFKVCSGHPALALLCLIRLRFLLIVDVRIILRGTRDQRAVPIPF
jgi:hypothetical protein